MAFYIYTVKATRCCYHCVHFAQHYGYSKGRFEKLMMGECVYPYIRFRRVTDHCANFEPKEYD